MTQALSLPSRPTSPTSAINEATFAALLQQLGVVDGELREELITNYLDESHPQLHRLLAAGRAADGAIAARIARSMRPASALVGASELAALLEQVELVAVASPRALPTLVALVEAAYDDVASSLGRLQNDGLAED